MAPHTKKHRMQGLRNGGKEEVKENKVKEYSSNSNIGCAMGQEALRAQN